MARIVCLPDITSMQSKPINNNPKYAIFENGDVVGPMGHKLATTFGKGNRYPLVRISLPGGKIKFIARHQAVAEHFIGPKPFPKAVVRHKDDNKLNYSASNLEWGTSAQNYQDSIRNLRRTSGTGAGNNNAKLDENDILDIRFLSFCGATMREMAIIYSVSLTHIFRICHRIQWSHM